MFNQTIKDNQKVNIHANPETTANNDAPCFAFQVAAANDSTGILNSGLQVTNGGGNIPNDPQFTITPQQRFFGADRVITLNLTGINAVGAPVKTTQMTVTIQGSLPDDGTLDHFAPSGDTPVAQ